jgi:hypothetical protein
LKILLPADFLSSIIICTYYCWAEPCLPFEWLEPFDNVDFPPLLILGVLYADDGENTEEEEPTPAF